jgi:hypothetical protein
MFSILLFTFAQHSKYAVRSQLLPPELKATLCKRVYPNFASESWFVSAAGIPEAIITLSDDAQHESVSIAREPREYKFG